MRIEEFADALSQKIERLWKAKAETENLLVAIDGRCAAGKTTLAQLLRERASCGCGVVHMDHFFLRAEQRTQERLREPGGNADYERVLAQVILPIKAGLDFSYRPYNCRRGDFDDAICVSSSRVNIIEGSYSCHPALKDYYDFRVFLSVDPETQLKRIRSRGGNACVADFKEKWIPLEERYFERFRVMENCDLTFISPTIDRKVLYDTSACGNL